MTVNLTLNQLWLYFLRLLSLAGVVVASVDPANLPASLRTGFAVAAGIILAVDRYVADPSTGIAAKPTQSSATVT